MVYHRTERVFTVSIRKDIYKGYFFPAPQPLTKRLKDILEDNVDEKYYLSDEQTAKIKFSKFNQERTRVQSDVTQTLLGRDYKDPKTCSVGNRMPKIIDTQGRTKKVCTPKEYAPTLRAQTHGNLPQVVEPIIVASRGRNPSNPSDRTARQAPQQSKD